MIQDKINIIVTKVKTIREYEIYPYISLTLDRLLLSNMFAQEKKFISPAFFILNRDIYRDPLIRVVLQGQI